MTIRLSAAIMAHPDRAPFVDELQATLDRPVPVVWDRYGDRHDTGSRAVAAYDPSATHHLVIQDDALPCRDLLAGTEAALAYVPGGSPVSLYTGRVQPFARVVDLATRAAVAAEASWITMPDLNWGVAVVLPVPSIEPMLRHYHRSSLVNYDRRMSTWFREVAKVRTWYTWPSLVDHRDSTSLVPGHGRKRHAHLWIGADVSALGVVWDGDVVSIDTRRNGGVQRRPGGRQLRGNRRGTA